MASSCQHCWAPEPIYSALKTKTKSISKKWADELPVFARIHSENSKVRAPQLMIYATSGHSGPKGWPQSFRSLKTMEDLTNPENDFIQVAMLMVILEEDFADIALLNQTAKVVCATERKLLKALNNQKMGGQLVHQLPFLLRLFLNQLPALS